jgi:hypothetical protein
VKVFIKRICRTSHTDVNGTYNIMLKAVQNAFANGIEGVGVHPMVVTIKE